MQSVSDKAYRALSPMERLRAVVSACARDDLTEANRLVDTCPQKTYRMPDVRFGYPLRSLMNLAQSHELHLYRCSLGVTLGTLMAEYLEAGSKGAEIAERLTLVSGQVLAARIVAWKRFCSGLGIPEEDIQAALFDHEDDPLGMVLRAADRLLADGAFEDGEVEMEQVETAYLKQLRERWELAA